MSTNRTQIHQTRMVQFSDLGNQKEETAKTARKNAKCKGFLLGDRMILSCSVPTLSNSTTASEILILLSEHYQIILNKAAADAVSASLYQRQ